MPPKIVSQDAKTVTIDTGDGTSMPIPRSEAERQGIVAKSDPLPTDEPGLEPPTLPGLGEAAQAGVKAAKTVAPYVGQGLKAAAGYEAGLIKDATGVNLAGNTTQAPAATPQTAGPLADLPGASVAAPSQPTTAAVPAGPGMPGESLDDKALRTDQIDRATAASGALDAEQQLAVKEGRELDDAKLQHIGRMHGMNEQAFAVARQHMQDVQDQTQTAVDAVHEWSDANKKTIMSGPAWEQALTVIGGILTLGISTNVQQAVLDRQVSHAAENVLKQSGLLDTLKSSFATQDTYQAAMKTAENDIVQNAVDYVTQTHSAEHVKINGDKLKSQLLDKAGDDRLKILQAVQKDKFERGQTSTNAFNAQTERMKTGAGGPKAAPPEQQDKIAEINAAVKLIDDGLRRFDEVGPEAYLGTKHVEGTKASEYENWKDQAALPIVAAIRGGPPRTVEEAKKAFESVAPAGSDRRVARNKLVQLKAQLVAKRGSMLGVMGGAGTSTDGLAPKDVGFKAGR